MKIRLDNFDTENLFRTISGQLGVEISYGFKRTEIILPEPIGKGKISSYKFQDGLSLFLFQAELKQDWDWEFHSNDSSPLYILFLLEGRVEDHKPEKQERIILHPMETLMVVHPAGPRRRIVFPAGEVITLAVLKVCQEKYMQSRDLQPEDLPENIRLLFSMAGTEMQYLYPPDRSTIDAVMLVRDIQNCTMDGLLQNCFIEAKIRELLFLKLQRTENNCCAEISITAGDIDQIKQARDILISDLKNAPTIEVLAKKAGLNRQKLKQKFKQLFGKTIFQYLREERMKTARFLLMGQQELSVRQVAQMVGYENVSHFSRRFREYYGLLPSEFLAIVWRNDQDN